MTLHDLVLCHILYSYILGDSSTVGVDGTSEMLVFTILGCLGPAPTIYDGPLCDELRDSVSCSGVVHYRGEHKPTGKMQNAMITSLMYGQRKFSKLINSPIGY